MDEVIRLFWNTYLWAAVLSWMVAQSVKLLLNLSKKKRWDFKVYASTGGMPSAHTATVSGLAMAVGRGIGFSSSQFAIALIFATIVITDALHLRQEVGRHSEVLEKLTKEKFNTSSGHRMSEVVVGLIIGAVVGWFL